MSSGVEVRIRPRRGLSSIDVPELWHYRDLVRMLVQRDFATRYRQTVLGPLWLVIQPMLVSGVFTLVFSVFAKLPTGAAPPGVFYLAGLAGWNYVSQTFLTTSQLYVVHGHLFGKIYFPRLCLPLATGIGNLFGLAVQVATVLGLAGLVALVWPGAGTIHPQFELIPLVPLMILQLGMTAMGFGLAIAALTVKYRDLAHLAAFLVQVWLYLTPVIYPFAAVPERFRALVALNPASAPVDVLRGSLIGGASATGAEMLIGFAVATVLLVVGTWFFRQTEKSAVDTL
jgi:lipopolysaccharide transport system permease protein